MLKVFELLVVNAFVVTVLLSSDIYLWWRLVFGAFFAFIDFEIVRDLIRNCRCLGQSYQLSQSAMRTLDSEGRLVAQWQRANLQRLYVLSDRKAFHVLLEAPIKAPRNGWKFNSKGWLFLTESPGLLELLDETQFPVEVIKMGKNGFRGSEVNLHL